MEHSPIKIEDKQVYARIQRYYDLMWEIREAPDKELTLEQNALDGQLEYLIHEFSSIFEDIIYEK